MQARCSLSSANQRYEGGKRRGEGRGREGKGGEGSGREGGSGREWKGVGGVSMVT